MPKYTLAAPAAASVLGYVRADMASVARELEQLRASEPLRTFRDLEGQRGRLLAAEAADEEEEPGALPRALQLTTIESRLRRMAKDVASAHEREHALAAQLRRLQAEEKDFRQVAANHQRNLAALDEEERRVLAELEERRAAIRAELARLYDEPGAVAVPAAA